MAILLKTASVRVSSIQIMQIRVQNKGKRVWKSRYDGDISMIRCQFLQRPRVIVVLEEEVCKGSEIAFKYLP
jgi:hypothetical protein